MGINFASMNLNDTPEFTAVAGDTEYEVRVSEAKEGTDKNGNPFLLLTLEITDEPTAKTFTKFLGVPSETMDARKQQSAKLGLKKALQAFGMDLDADYEVDDFVGKTAWAVLGVENTEKYGDQNFIKTWVISK